MIRKPDIEFPIRINKFLAAKGYTTRIGADEYVKKGLVTINGITAVLGSKVMSPADTVEVLASAKRYHYYAYNKPHGIVTINAQRDEKEIANVATFPVPVFPIGRLDKDSSGLLIMTDDGRMTKRLLEPEFDHEKEYAVTVDRPFEQSFLDALSRGVNIGDYKTKPCKTKRISKNRFSIILTEGKNRQIRRMCEALGYTVRELVRVRIMNIELGSLPQGKSMQLKGKELAILLKALSL
jgi:23S rRNA pseudouridine2604 synthase